MVANYRHPERVRSSVGCIWNSCSLSVGAQRVAYDACGDLDQAQLLAELARLGIRFQGCYMQGIQWQAGFVPPGRGAKPVSAVAACASVAVLEAATLALEAWQAQMPVNSTELPPPTGWQTWRQGRPWTQPRQGRPLLID